MPRFEPEPSLVALVDVIRRREAPTQLAEDTRAFLAARGVAGDDLDALTEVGAERLLVYRALVHNRLRNATRDFIPRTVARLGPTAFRAEFEAFVEGHAVRSPYLRDVPEEFVEWAADRWQRDDAIADYLVDLARHELLQLTVRNDPRGGEPATGQPVALDRPLRFDGSVRLMSYDHAVHKLSSERADKRPAEATPTRLLVYRDPAHEVRYLELTEFAAAALAELVVRRQPVAQGLQAAAAALGEPLGDDKLSSAAVLLADLADRKVLLGAEP